MAAYLVPLDEGHVLVPLEKTILLVGRQADCDVILSRSRKVSRKHCALALVNTAYVVRDLGSTNGVYVNGQRIEQEQSLVMGDQLTIADVRFRLDSQPHGQSRNGTDTAAVMSQDHDSIPDPRRSFLGVGQNRIASEDSGPLVPLISSAAQSAGDSSLPMSGESVV